MRAWNPRDDASPARCLWRMLEARNTSLRPVSHKHENLLRAIFHDPISGNIHWREIESLLNHLGASIESLSGARMRVKLHGYEGILHRPHRGNTLGRGDIQHLRDYLSHARATPSQYEAARDR